MPSYDRPPANDPIGPVNQLSTRRPLQLIAVTGSPEEKLLEVYHGKIKRRKCQLSWLALDFSRK